MKLRPATAAELASACALVAHLKYAREHASALHLAGVRERILAALRSADGAQRHIARRAKLPQPEATT